MLTICALNGVCCPSLLIFLPGIFLLLSVVVVGCQAIQLRYVRPKGGMLRDPEYPHSHNHTKLPPAQWFEQDLDHFNGQNTDTWKQRFFVNSTFYKPGGPVFLYIGGEGPASAKWVVVGQMMVMAKEHNAMAILLEHRYYGESHPTPDLSLPNLRYLSSEQGLADLANFRSKYGRAHQLDSAKWITFGGSYPGALSAWARLKYPHLFHAAIASSAPVYAELNFTQYLEVVQSSILQDGGAECLDAIRRGMRSVNNMVVTSPGRAQLDKIFHTCMPIADSVQEVASFAQGVTGMFMGVVQYNRVNLEHNRDNATTITNVCNIMKNTTISEPLHRLGAVNDFLVAKRKKGEKKCFDTSYKKYVEDLKNTTWNDKESDRQWFYQVCTEFGYLQSSQANATVQPFGNLFPISTQVQQCIDVFGITADQLAEHVAWSNSNYGSVGIKGSRIIFPNGNIDPWHALSILPGHAHLQPSVIPILINGTAHCANMYSSHPDDLPSLVQARRTIFNLLYLFLNGEGHNGN